MQCSALYILYYPWSKIVSQSCSLLNSHSLSHCHSTHWSVIIELLSRHLLFWLMTTIGSIKGNSLHVLFQDTDWEVLERVLVNLPLLLQNKTLILSGKHDLINSLCHQLCAMVWTSYKGLMYNICLNEMNVVFSWLIFSFYGVFEHRWMIDYWISLRNFMAPHQEGSQGQISTRLCFRYWLPWCPTTDI